MSAPLLGPLASLPSTALPAGGLPCCLVPGASCPPVLAAVSVHSLEGHRLRFPSSFSPLESVTSFLVEILIFQFAP